MVEEDHVTPDPANGCLGTPSREGVNVNWFSSPSNGDRKHGSTQFMKCKFKKQEIRVDFCTIRELRIDVCAAQEIRMNFSTKCARGKAAGLQSRGSRVGIPVQLGYDKTM
ncbi:hypothetical protein BgiMline_022132 [Biomphalaria glabrata]|nr:hypothetical protein BgiMline_010004 [Biomphalaria glabrata]